MKNTRNTRIASSLKGALKVGILEQELERVLKIYNMSGVYGIHSLPRLKSEGTGLSSDGLVVMVRPLSGRLSGDEIVGIADMFGCDNLYATDGVFELEYKMDTTGMAEGGAEER